MTTEEWDDISPMPTTPEYLEKEIWKRYGSFELSHHKNQAIVENILEFILNNRREFAERHAEKQLEDFVGFITQEYDIYKDGNYFDKSEMIENFKKIT